MPCAVILLLAACDKDAEKPSSSSTEAKSASPRAEGVEVVHRPCRLEIDSPRDGEIDGVYDIAYEDGRPARALADYGEGSDMNSCVSFGYREGLLATKTVFSGECEGNGDADETSTVRGVDSSNLVRVTFPDDEMTYHYVTAPGDFTFLLARTSYNLGPQPVEDVQVGEGRFESLTVSSTDPPHSLEADYRAGKLIRVSEKDPEGAEIGYASFHYRDDNLVKVERRLATMSKGQTEEVRLLYDCDGKAKE